MKSDTQDVEGAAPKKNKQNKTQTGRQKNQKKKKRKPLYGAATLRTGVTSTRSPRSLFPSSWGEPPRKLRKKI